MNAIADPYDIDSIRASFTSEELAPFDDYAPPFDEYAPPYDDYMPPFDTAPAAQPPASVAQPTAPASAVEEEREILTYEVDWDRAQIGRMEAIIVKGVIKGYRMNAVANFAARIVEIMEVRDDLNDLSGERMLIRYVIEVATRPLTDAEAQARLESVAAGRKWTDPRVVRIPGHVYDNDLADLDGWLRRGGAAVKSAGANRNGGRQMDADIAKAIEAFSMKTSRRTQLAVKRTGWVNDPNGRQTYVSEGNGINALGNTDIIIGQLERSVTFRAPEGADALERARRGFLWYLKALETPDAKNTGGIMNRATGLAFYGAVCWSMAGLEVQHGVYVHAAKGTGKSTGLNPFIESFDDEGSGAVLVASNGTSTVLGDAYKRMHQCVRFVDDVIRDRASKSKDEAAEDGVDTIARIAFDGPVKAARARMKQVQGGEWVEGDVEKSWPTMGVIGERLPQKGSSSGVARLFGTRFKGVNLALISEADRVDDLRAFWGLYLQAIAALRDAGVKEFVAEWAEWKRERAAEAAARLGGALGSTDEIARRSALLATVQGGFLLALRVLGLDGEEWVEQDMKVLERSIIEWAEDSTEQHDSGTENVLNALRTALATSARYVVNQKASPGQDVLGGRGFDAEGNEVMNIVPKVALAALGWESSATDRLKRSLAPHLVSETQRSARLYPGARSVKVYAVRYEAWDTDGDEEQEDVF